MDQQVPDCCKCQGVCAGAIKQKSDLSLDDHTANTGFGAIPVIWAHAEWNRSSLFAVRSFTDPGTSSGRSLRLHVCSWTC